jgi:hypothetical protein
VPQGRRGTSSIEHSTGSPERSAGADGSAKVVAGTSSHLSPSNAAMYAWTDTAQQRVIHTAPPALPSRPTRETSGARDSNLDVSKLLLTMKEVRADVHPACSNNCFNHNLPLDSRSNEQL